MPDQLLELALADHAAIVKDRFALLETENASLKAQGVELATQLNRAVAELATIKAQFAGLVPWGPGTPLVDGGVYLFPSAATALNLRVEVSCTFIMLPGGSFYPSGQAPAIDHKRGLLTLVGFREHHPNPGPKKDGKWDIGAGVATASPDGLTLVNHTVGVSDQPVKILPGAKGVAVIRTKAAGNVSSAFIGGWGDVSDVLVGFCSCPDSLTENSIRFSPENNIAPRRVAVLFSDISNVGNKSAIDLRQVTGGIAAFNRARADEGQAALTTGNAKPGNPGSNGVYFIENEVPSGNVSIHEVVDNLVIDGTRIGPWTTRPVGNAIYVNATGTMKRARVVGNVGVNAAGVEQKPLLAWHKGQKPAAVEEAANAWVSP